MAKELPITEFDMITLNQTTHMFKAMIPFLDYSLQRSLSLLIRMNELQQTMQFYSRPENINHFTTCNCNVPKQPIHSINDILENEEMINTVLKYCPEQYANMINSFRQFSKMSDLFNMMNTANGGDFTSMFNGGGFSPDIMNMLNPEMLNNLFNAQSNASSNGSESSQHKSAAGENSNTGEQPESAAPNAGPFPFSGGPMGNMMNNFMNPQQQQMYNDYINQLDHIDFEKKQNE